MSATNLTKNLKLPQFVASDKPSWLGDVNGTMLKIDNGYGTLSGDISKANDTASSAKSQSDANTQTLTKVNSELENQGNRITALEAGGGTEQLEQRVNTLSTDVESLQTRADTFEEEIAENGKKITDLTTKTSQYDTSIKALQDNVTTLDSTTSGLLENQANIRTELTKTTSNANSALTASNRAEASANAASNTAGNALSTANAALNASTPIAFNSFNPVASIVVSPSTNVIMFKNANTITTIPFIITAANIRNTYQLIGTFSLPFTVNNILSGLNEESAVISQCTDNNSMTFNTYVSATGSTINVYMKLAQPTSSIATYKINVVLPNIVVN